jgi:predicted nuclease of predicted toxin-antitoxin system
LKLLFDQNLSRNLVRRVHDLFPGSVHVAGIGLDSATDRAVWKYAEAHGFAIVSKDADFADMARSADGKVKVIYLAIGNASTALVEELMRLRAHDIEAFEFTSDFLLVIES